MLALSTAWNSDTHTNPTDIIREIKDAGFDTIEVGYTFTAEKLEGLVTAMGKFGVKALTVHAFCPLPPEPETKRHTSGYYYLSSLDDDERMKAVEYTKRTVDTAERFRAQVVIIHAGTIEIGGDYIPRMMHMYKEGKVKTTEYDELKQEFLRTRSKKATPYVDAVKASLKELTSYASTKGVKIGLETRYYPSEIPNIEETEYFLGLFKRDELRYWHDAGHAEVNDRLRIAPHEAFLERFSDSMLGMHIHDVKGLEDHFAPFTGDTDFSKITPYMGSDIIKIIEAHSKASAKQLKEATARIQKMINKKAHV